MSQATHHTSDPASLPAEAVGDFFPVHAESALSRALCGLGALGWIGFALALELACLRMFDVPWAVRLLAPAWFLLGAAWPRAWFYSLALALPWFGNNPGGGHHLYLLEIGLAGLVARHLAERALGRIAPRRNPLDLWITLFVSLSWLALFPQWRFLMCEFMLHKAVLLDQAAPPRAGGGFALVIWLKTPCRFLWQIMNHYGTADVFGLQLALKLTLGAGLYAALRDRPWSASRRRRLWFVLLAGLVFTVLIGWPNYLGRLSLAWWRAENPDITRFHYQRLQSLYWHAGWLAQYLEALAPAAVAFGWMARRAAVRRGWWGLAAALALTQLFTMQRAGWIGLAGGYGAVLGLAALGEPDPARRRRLLREVGWLAAGLALAILAALAVSPSLRHRAGELLAYEHRTGMWRATLVMLRHFGLGGCGLGNFYHIHTGLFPAGHPWAALDKVTAHNLYLQLWVERGLGGLVLFLVIYAGLLRRAARAAGTPDAPSRAPALAVLGGLTALGLDGLFQYVFYVRTIEILFWLLAGWAVSAEAGAGAPAGPGRRRAWMAGLALLCVTVGGMLWENRVMLRNYQITLDADKTFFTAGAEARLPLPAGARRVQLDLGCVDINAPTEPVIFTLKLEGRTLERVEFNKVGWRTVTLELPPGRSARAPLVVHASRTWFPWRWGLRFWPFTNLGVLYLPPEAVEE